MRVGLCLPVPRQEVTAPRQPSDGGRRVVHQTAPGRVRAAGVLSFLGAAMLPSLLGAQDSRTLLNKGSSALSQLASDNVGNLAWLLGCLGSSSCLGLYGTTIDCGSLSLGMHVPTNNCIYSFIHSFIQFSTSYSSVAQYSLRIAYSILQLYTHGCPQQLQAV